MSTVVLDEVSTRYVRSQLARMRRVDLVIAIVFWTAHCFLWLVMIAAATDAVRQFLQHHSGMAVAAGTITGGACFAVRWSHRVWSRRRSRLLPPPALPPTLMN
ncbi:MULTISPECIES: hypothetical protein [unclassified Streptomyces]|uniref:hypothetical protein n=1 Tax=unclassified Streptomyces TaxID=2593676 RepID=UPI002E81CA56|nr:hypothetical protein [Streptomyces sp. NBC_00523]WUC98376.1 hypothetical protein OHS17_01370 [Streptomyces sp. NBC_00523]